MDSGGSANSGVRLAEPPQRDSPQPVGFRLRAIRDSPILPQFEEAGKAMDEIYIFDTMQPAPPVRAAGIEWPGFTDGDGTFVTIETVDDLMMHGEYVLLQYHIGGRGDQPTVEPTNGTRGPRFTAPTIIARFWEVLDAGD